MDSRRFRRTLIIGQLLCTAAMRSWAQATQAPTPVYVEGTAIKRALQGARDLHIVSDGRPIWLSSVPDSVRLVVGDWVYGTTAAGTPVLSTRGENALWELPLRFSPVTPNGGLDQRLRIDVQVDGVGMKYVKGDDRYEGTIEVWLIDEYHPQGSNQLPSPVALSLAASVDSVDPSLLSIPHTGIPFARIRLFDANPQGNVTLRIRTDVDTATYEVHVPVVRRPVMIRPSPNRINGFGLESAALLVLLGGGRLGDSVLVTLTTTRGYVEHQQIRVATAGSGQATLWSRGLGRASVTAETPDQGSDSADISFAFPWWFLLAIVVGGALGSAIRQGWEAIKDKEWPPTSKFFKEMLIGVCTGALAAVMQSVGIDILHFGAGRGGEAAVGVFAAVGAVLGPALVDVIKQKFGPGRKAAKPRQGAKGRPGAKSKR